MQHPTSECNTQLPKSRVFSGDTFKPNSIAFEFRKLFLSKFPFNHVFEANALWKGDVENSISVRISCSFREGDKLGRKQKIHPDWHPLVLDSFPNRSALEKILFVRRSGSAVSRMFRLPPQLLPQGRLLLVRLWLYSTWPFLSTH